jgi:hypothetical protein
MFALRCTFGLRASPGTPQEGWLRFAETINDACPWAFGQLTGPLDLDALQRFPRTPGTKLRSNAAIGASRSGA